MIREPNKDAFRPDRYEPLLMFIERVSANWTAVWKIWRTVMDWATWLYVLLPGFFIFGGMYRDLLRDPPVGLDHNILVGIFILLGLIQLIGKYRTFAEPGDGLFLHRRARWIRGKVMGGFLYGIVTRILISSLFIAVASPLLLQIFRLSGSYMFVLILYCSLFGFVWMLLRDRLTQTWKGWKRALVSIAGYLALLYLFVSFAVIGEDNFAAMGLAIAALTGISAWLMIMRLKMHGSFLHEIAIENSSILGNVKFILKEAMDKKPAPMLRRPMLFKRSQPLLKHRDDAHRLLDSWFKSVLRRSDLFQPVLSFTGAGIAATLASPALLAAIVWLALPMLLMLMVHRQWLNWLTEPYIALFKWRIEMLEQAANKARVWGALFKNDRMGTYRRREDRLRLWRDGLAGPGGGAGSKLFLGTVR